MKDLELLKKYFPGLTESQLEAFAKLGALYQDWNAKINVVSRQDMDHLYERHILHSLALASFMGPLADGTRFMDLGTGGGFPGIPMAIFYPNCHFHLIDRIGKKIRVAQEIAAAIGLTNVSFQHGDSGECREKYDYVVSRAVMTLDGLLKACAKNVVAKAERPNALAPGLLCLKGGDLAEEFRSVSRPIITEDIAQFFDGEFFDTKKIVYVPLGKPFGAK